MTGDSGAESAARAAQIPLAFAHRQALGREDFIVTACNDAAVALVDRWPDWPGPVAAVWGPPGCGKSHLAGVFQDRAGARPLDAGTLDLASLADRLGPSRAWVLDDAEHLLRGPEAVTDPERVLFHLLNLVRERRGHLLLTARNAPARWPVTLPDLASRLSAVAAVEIGSPDDDLLAYLFRKLFSDRQLDVSPRVIDYLVPRIERSFDAVQAVVERMDRLSLAEKKSISVRLAREVLGDALD